jgi:sec-independent protein translocase protein TatB
MFDFDAGKIIIIGIVALIFIGPKELPRVMRQIGQAVSKMRRMASEFQSQFMDAMNEADFAEIKAEAAKISEQAKIDVGFNPVAEIKAGLTEAMAEPKELSAPAAHSETTSAETAPAETQLGEDAAHNPYLSPAPETPRHDTQAASVASDVAKTGAVEPPVDTPLAELPATPHVAHESVTSEHAASEHIISQPLAPPTSEPAAPEPLPLRTSA